MGWACCSGYLPPPGTTQQRHPSLLECGEGAVEGRTGEGVDPSSESSTDSCSTPGENMKTVHLHTAHTCKSAKHTSCTIAGCVRANKPMCSCTFQAQLHVLSDQISIFIYSSARLPVRVNMPVCPHSVVDTSRVHVHVAISLTNRQPAHLEMQLCPHPSPHSQPHAQPHSQPHSQPHILSHTLSNTTIPLATHPLATHP